ncbi:MAG: acetoacetate decarboxylase family protein [Alphaproteobacteria bacterium]|nr:acetoacetate decarboxylase family protein [Alphaproteobacteria bacterium]
MARNDGFTAAIDPTGHGALYGAGPWRFAGHSATVFARCDAGAVRALLPEPLEPWGEPIVRFSVHWLQCDLGFGGDFASAHPERSQFHEAVIGIAARCGERVGYWDPFLWCDSDAEIAVGREMYGWPQRAGTLALTLPHPQRGRRVGDVVVGRVGRLTQAVFEIAIEIAAAGEPDVPAPAFACFFTERVLPDPGDRSVVRELYASTMDSVVAADVFHGKASLRVAAPELLPLAPGAILGGRVNTVSWTKDRGTLIARRVIAAPR